MPGSNHINPGRVERRRARFYRSLSVWFVVAAVFLPAGASLLGGTRTDLARELRSLGFLIAVIGWPLILVVTAAVALAATIRRSCDTVGLLILWLSVGFAFWFYPSRQPWW